MDLVDRSAPQLHRVLTVAQRCRDCRHHRCGNALDITRSGAVNMTAEDRDDSSRTKQDAAQQRHCIPVLEVKRLRLFGHQERRMVRENRNGFGSGVGFDQIGQVFEPLAAEVALCRATGKSRFRKVICCRSKNAGRTARRPIFCNFRT